MFPPHCTVRLDLNGPAGRQQKRSHPVVIVLVAASTLFLASAAFAQITISNPVSPVLPVITSARLIEWDLPPQADTSPGAMVVDTQGDDRNRLWFVTRAFEPHVYRMDFPSSLMKGSARWTSWALSPTALAAGGVSPAMRRVRPSKDRRFVFVRTLLALERIDTKNCYGSPQTCERTVWLDQDGTVNSLSDLAVDDYNNVYSTHAPGEVVAAAYLQRLTPASPSATITRWAVGGGAGLCTGFASDPCVAGVAVHPFNRYLVYYSEEFSNNIAELNTSPTNTSTSKVRRWSLAALSAEVCANQQPCRDIFGPRQLHIDRSGKVWVVTGSGHLVSLDPHSNFMTAHDMPSEILSDPFGVAPDDDVIGYTNAGANKVGMLIPRAKAFCIAPQPAYVEKVTTNIPSDPQRALVTSNKVTPYGKTVLALITSQSDGTYVEAQINERTDATPNDSTLPLGITPAKAKAEGTFFYAVGEPTANGKNRVGFVRFPTLKEKMKHPRDDDDRDDGWAGEDKWHDWHGHADADDDDDDGIRNAHDSSSGSETVDRRDSTSLANGQSADYSMIASPTSLALLAIAEADDPMAQLGIDVYNAQGILIARSVPSLKIAVAQVALPAAGTYTWRVRNYGAAAVTYTPTSIVREPALPLELVP
jgi:hypothetical protein